MVIPDANKTATVAEQKALGVKLDSVIAGVGGGGGSVDANNSSAAVLAGDAVFTGTATEILTAAAISVYLDASHGSAADGVSIQFSSDGTNWDLITTFTYAAGNARQWQFGPQARYFRVVYTNGSTLQTHFRLQTILHTANMITTIHRVGDELAVDRSAEVVKAVLMAREGGTGNFVPVDSTELGGLLVDAEQSVSLDAMNATTGWAAISDDTTGLATSVDHVLGTVSLLFNKADGTANTVVGGIEKTISAVDLGDVAPHDLIQTVCYVPSLADVVSVFVRVGTDSSNYQEWRVAAADLNAATWQTLAVAVGDVSHSASAGNGWDPSAVTYIAVGVVMDAEDDTLASIQFDHLDFHSNQHVSSTINTEVSSSVSSPNITLLKVGSSVVDQGAGNVSAGSQRVAIATDDVNLAAIKAALEILDDLVLAEDAAHSGGESGILPFSVRQDVLAALAGTTGDRQPLSTDGNGALYTREDRRGVISVSGTQATATSTQIIAAPGANKAIHVVGAMLQQNGDAPTAQLVAIEDGTGATERANFRLSANDGAGAVLPFPITIATNEALKLDSDQSQSFAYTISYRIIDV